MPCAGMAFQPLSEATHLVHIWQQTPLHIGCAVELKLADVYFAFGILGPHVEELGRVADGDNHPDSVHVTRFSSRHN